MAINRTATSGGGRRWFWLGLAIGLGAGAAVGVVHWRFRAAALEEELHRVLETRSGGLYAVRVGGTRLSLLNRSYTVTNLEIVLDSIRWKDRRDRPAARYSLRVPEVTLTGIGLAAMARGQIAIDRVVVRSPAAEVFVDRTVRRKPGDTTRVMPHQILRRAGRAIQIGSIGIENGDIEYLELARDGARPGKFRFGAIQLEIENVTNDTTQPREAGLSRITLSVKLAEVARLGAGFEYDLLEPDFSIRYEGGLAATNPQIFNSMLTDLEGVRITSGRVDSVWFKVDVKNDMARGQLRALYRDFRLETLDKATRKQDLGDKIQTFVSNNFKLRTENPEGHHGETPMTAPISLRRPVQTPMIQYLWHTLRQGIAKTIGM